MYHQILFIRTSLPLHLHFLMQTIILSILTTVEIIIIRSIAYNYLYKQQVLQFSVNVGSSTRYGVQYMP